MKTLKVFFCSAKYFILVFIFFINASFISLATGDKILDLSFKKIETDLSSKITYEDTGVKIETDSSKRDKECYLYIYQNIKENWSMYHNFCIEIQNKNKSSQRINLSIQSKNMLEFRLKEGSEIFLEDRNIIYSDKIKDGCIEVPGEFEGKIYVNFNNLINEKSNVVLDSNTLSNIVSWGITFIPSDEEHNIVTIKKLSLLSQEKLRFLNNIKIIGDEEVQIPILGQSISQYEVLGLGSNSKIKYSLIGKQNNVNLSQNGKLTLSNKAKPGQIILQVNVDDNFKFGKKITLTESWSINKKDKDGVPYTLVSPEQSPTVQDMKEINFMNSIITFIRILFVSLVVVCFGIYFYWRKCSKTK